MIIEKASPAIMPHHCILTGSTDSSSCINGIYITAICKPSALDTPRDKEIFPGLWEP